MHKVYRSRFLYHFSISLFWAHLFLPDPPCYSFRHFEWRTGFSFFSHLLLFSRYLCPWATVTVRCLYEISGPCRGSCLGHLSLQPTWRGRQGSEGADCQSGGAEEGLVTVCTLTFLMVLWKNAQLFSLMHRWCWPNHLSHEYREQRRASEVFGELTEVRTSSGVRLVPRRFITPPKNYRRATLAMVDCKAAQMRLAFIANTSTSHVYYLAARGTPSSI